MAKFRKKPVVIEAVQLTWASWPEICEFVPKPWFVEGVYLDKDGKITKDTNGRVGLLWRAVIVGIRHEGLLKAGTVVIRDDEGIRPTGSHIVGIVLYPPAFYLVEKPRSWTKEPPEFTLRDSAVVHEDDSIENVGDPLAHLRRWMKNPKDQTLIPLAFASGRCASYLQMIVLHFEKLTLCFCKRGGPSIRKRSGRTKRVGTVICRRCWTIDGAKRELKRAKIKWVRGVESDVAGCYRKSDKHKIV